MDSFLRFVIFFLLLVKTNGDSPQDQEDLVNCLLENNLSKQLIEEVGTKKPLPEHNADFNTYAKCFFTKKGLITADNDIDWDRLTEILNEQLNGQVPIVTVVNLCRKEITVDEDMGSTAVRVHNCVLRHAFKIRKSSEL